MLHKEFWLIYSGYSLILFMRGSFHLLLLSNVRSVVFYQLEPVINMLMMSLMLDFNNPCM